MISYSSSKQQSSLKKVSCRNSIELLRVIDRYSSKELDFISRRYSDKHKYFKETLQFLIDIGWVISDDAMVHLNKKIPINVLELKPDMVLHEVVFAMMAANKTISSTLFSYLSEFRIDGNIISCAVPNKLSLNIVPIRDMLLESGLIVLDRGREIYSINSDYSHIYFQAKNLNSPKTTKGLLAKQRSNSEIGFLAEKTILDYEIKRINDPTINVDHVSDDNPLSCFDIHSFTINHESKTDRFIEVKAVSISDYSFFWSKSERDVAQILRNKYFLYLLPVTGPSTFSVSDMKQIQDPHISLLQNREQWNIEQSIIRCSLFC